MIPTGSAPGTSTLPVAGKQPFLVSLAVLLVSLTATVVLWSQSIESARRNEAMRLEHRFTQAAQRAAERASRLSTLHQAIEALVRDRPLPGGIWQRYAAAIEARKIDALLGFGVVDAGGKPIHWYPAGTALPQTPEPGSPLLLQSTPALRAWRVVTLIDTRALAAGLEAQPSAPGSPAEYSLQCRGEGAPPPPPGAIRRTFDVPLVRGLCRLDATAPAPSPFSAGRPILEAGVLLSFLLATLVFHLERTWVLALRQAAVIKASLIQTTADSRHLISIANRSDNGFMILDGAGRVLWANDVVHKRSGYTREQISGRDAFLLLHGPGADVNQIAEARRNLLAGRPVRFEAPAFAKAGQSYWLEIDLQPIIAADGGLEYVLGISRPLTPDREIRDSALRMHRALESVTDGIAIWDRQGRYLFHNPAFEQQFGLSIEECSAAGGPSALMVDPPACFTIENQPLDQNGSHTREVAMRSRGHEIREMRATLSTIHNELGLPIGRIAVFTDITEAKQIERRLREARDAALEAAAVRSAFLANVSHELRTPLNGVTGMVNLLLTTELDREQQEYAHLAQISGSTLLRVINDILDFSKMEAGRLQLESVSFDLPQLLDECAAVAAIDAKAKGLDFEMQIDPTLRRRLHGDPTRLRQVVGNLLSNAVKFTGRGGVRLIAGEHSGRTRIRVIDTGIGIPTSALDQVFQPFMQGDASTTRRFGGTGLGLAICRELVGMMGGVIGVSSQPGMGATFTVDLPLEPAAAESDKPQLVS